MKKKQVIEGKNNQIVCVFVPLLLQGKNMVLCRNESPGDSVFNSYITSALRTYLYIWVVELKWIEITCQLIYTWHQIKDPEEKAIWELDSIFYLKVVFNNHKSEVCHRNNLWFIWVTLSFLEWKDSFSYRNWKRSTPSFWTYSWHSFVNKSSPKSQRCFPSLLSMKGYNAGNKHS